MPWWYSKDTMQVLIAVIDDLFQFVCKAFSGAIPYTQNITKKSNFSQVKPESALDSYQKTLEKIQNTSALVSVPQSVPSTIPKVTDTTEAFRTGEQYFIGVIGTYFYHDPVLAFDNALKRLEYGMQVRLVSLQGRWAQVRLAGVVGWVFKDALVLQSDDVYPKFTSDISYDAQNPETVKLRACIDDLFGGARGEHDLSAAEFVQYQLQQKKRFIDWGDIRMRIPGTWQRKLRGKTGVHMSITPKTESVMEYVVDDIGHLAFVEAVFPDGSIKIAQIGKMDDISYTEETIQPEQWKELQPVFIMVV